MGRWYDCGSRAAAPVLRRDLLRPASPVSPGARRDEDPSMHEPSDLPESAVSPPRVGIIGAGAMGWAMASNLQRRGYAVCVRDIDARAEARARAAAMPVCASPAQLAECSDLVLVVVVDAQQMAEVLLRPGDGLVHARREAGAARLCVLLCSTIAPADTERFAAALAAQGVDVLDAPISGGPARAAEGTLSMMVAGAAAVRARCRTLLSDLALSVHVMGQRPGDGARAKLVNNLLAGTNLVAGIQAMALGIGLGLDRHSLFDLIKSSSGASWVFTDRMERALQGDFAPRARAAILAKDLTLALRMAADAGASATLGREALAVFEAALAAGLGDEDDAAVIKTVLPGF